MKIVSKSQANIIARRYPNAIRTRFDSGKYTWTGSSADYIGRDVLDISFVRAVYRKSAVKPLPSGIGI